MITVQECEVPSYRFDRQLGSGSFGTVFKAFDLSRKCFVAIKRTLKLGGLVSREYMILKEITDCQQCIRMWEIFYTTNSKGFCIQHLVFEYLPENLSSFIRYRHKSVKPLNHKEVVGIMRQLLRGLVYLHQKGIMHRDIKPENLLIDPESLQVKICDFGSAKYMHTDTNTPYIVSRYYRAPELIFCSTDYDGKIDIWSAGCVFIELFSGVPIFPGRSEGDQFIQQARVLGPPSLPELQRLTRSCPVKGNCILNALLIKPKGNFEEIFKNSPIPESAASFARSLLAYNPDDRLSAADCLLHPFLN
jgi:serine/threonine protein kinase